MHEYTCVIVWMNIEYAGTLHIDGHLMARLKSFDWFFFVGYGHGRRISFQKHQISSIRIKIR